MSAATEAARQEWIGRGQELARAGEDHRFQIGDWLLEGLAENYISRGAYDAAERIFTDIPRETLYILAHVARRVKSLIRIKDLSWSHHRIVAHLGPQKQRELLEFAAKNRIRVRAFQAHVSTKFPPKQANPPEPAEELEDDNFDPNQHWDDMPECDNDDLTPFQAVIVNFANREDRKAFEKLVGQKMTDSTRSIWFPEAKDAPYKGTQYVAVEPEPEEVAV